MAIRNSGRESINDLFKRLCQGQKSISKIWEWWNSITWHNPGIRLPEKQDFYKQRTEEITWKNESLVKFTKNGTLLNEKRIHILKKIESFLKLVVCGSMVKSYLQLSQVFSCREMNNFLVMLSFSWPVLCLWKSCFSGRKRNSEPGYIFSNTG